MTVVVIIKRELVFFVVAVVVNSERVRMKREVLRGSLKVSEKDETKRGEKRGMKRINGAKK